MRKQYIRAGIWHLRRNQRKRGKVFLGAITAPIIGVLVNKIFGVRRRKRKRAVSERVQLLNGRVLYPKYKRVRRVNLLPNINVQRHKTIDPRKRRGIKSAVVK